MAVWREDGLICIEQTLGELVSFREVLWRLAERVDPDPDFGVEHDDPFEAWERSLSTTSSVTTDPMLLQLFPNPYGDDTEEGVQWRRLSFDTARRNRCSELYLALDGVNDTIVDIIAERERAGFPEDLRVDLVGILAVKEEAAEAWLRATNICRLAMSHELGITTAAESEELDEIDPEDSRFYDAVRFWALGELQYQILFALDGDRGL